MSLLAINRGLADEFDCITAPQMISELGSATRGVLDIVAVERGDQVKEGEVVAQLMSGVERAAVEVASARADATAQIESAEVRKAFSKRKLQRMTELSEKKYASDFDVDEAETDLVLAEKAIGEASDALTLAAAELRRAEEVLKLMTIRAPYDGVVVERFLNPGERVEDQPIIKLAKLDPLYVEAMLPISMLGKVEVGDTATIVTELDASEAYEAEVVVVDPLVDAASGLFGVRLELPNEQLHVSAGLECVVTFSDMP
jgi:RND family efflux transporter MFP subunit